MTVPENYLADTRAQFGKYKEMAERAMAQVSDEQLFDVPYGDGNSIAIIAKHLAGNMLSRWTDFLTTDGEKADRNRDDEFEMSSDWGRARLFTYWESGWKCLFEAIDPLNPDDLEKSITIRGEQHRVLRAINRQLTHYAYHVGQMVLLARYHAGSEWKSLSIPRGESDAFNADNWGKRTASRPKVGH